MKNLKFLILIVLFFSVNFIFSQQEEQKKPSLKYKHEKIYQPYMPNYKADGTTKKIKNVILLIGDGMGSVQVSAAMYANNGNLAILNMKNSGFSRTQSTSHFTTDSAAGGTALATGTRTFNGAIGVDANEKPLVNMTELLAPLGYATGIITTDNISGATPSSFYAHHKSRKDNKEILDFLPKSKLDFFAGGSEELFEKYAPEKISELKKIGFTIENDYRKLSNHKKASRLGLIGNELINPIKDGREDYLSETLAFALNFLSEKSKTGFFIMVEGAQIDWGGHLNDTQYVITEAIDFDKAVSEALKFADKNGETLVIVTADHETGGASFNTYKTTDNTIELAFSTGGHSAVMVPVFAYGPFSQNFRGAMDNTEIFEKIKNALIQGK